MPTVVRFTNVAKRYKLGVSRISLPAAISKWMRQSVLHGRLKTSQEGFHWALKDMSFELARGESLALIGPNGAGKSTVLKLLAKITVPTSGRIQVNGQVSALIELGAGFHPDLTGRENVYLNGTILGLKRREIDRRFRDIVSFAELDRFIDTPLKRYSSGMTVRLGFAVAACMEPDILLVDEVLAVGDASFRHKCIERIWELHQRGTSLIFVSHDLGLVKAICETAILLEGGVIQAKGIPSEIIDKYNEMLDARRTLRLKHAESSDEGRNADVEITKVEVLISAAESADGYIRGDRPVEIRASYIAYRAMSPASALIRIYRSDYLSCCVMHTVEDGFDLSISPGKGTVSVFLDPLQLSGGRYHAIAWILDAGGINGISRGASDWFQVPNAIPGQEAHESVFEPKRRWMQQGLGVKADIAKPSV
jgi:ABC-type polysaccharide/polyol phosphate transport system ATPase subunit